MIGAPAALALAMVITLAGASRAQETAPFNMPPERAENRSAEKDEGLMRLMEEQARRLRTPEDQRYACLANARAPADWPEPSATLTNLGKDWVRWTLTWKVPGEERILREHTCTFVRHLDGFAWPECCAPRPSSVLPPRAPHAYRTPDEQRFVCLAKARAPADWPDPSAILTSLGSDRVRWTFTWKAPGDERVLREHDCIFERGYLVD